MKKISIIIPCFNVETYLKSCVDSVLNQKINFEIEILIIDDESTDGSFSIAQRLVAENSNIKVIAQKNIGLGGARNTGLKNAQGDSILFLDADDRLAENALSKLLQIAKKYELDILEFAAEGIDTKGNTVYRKSNKTCQPQDGISYYNKVRYMNSACNKLYQRDFLNSHNLLFREKIYIEDFEFNTRVFSKADKVLATDMMGAYFLQSSESITRNKDSEKIKKMQQDIIKVIKITAEEYKNNQEIGKEIDAFFSERLAFLTSTLFYQLFKRNADYATVKELKNNLISDKIFFPNHYIHEKRKDIFRRIIVNHLYLYPVISTIKKWL